MEQNRTGPMEAFPDRLPTLERGSHGSGEPGICAMEAAAWLAGEPWTDHPRAVHPVIARVARATNDALDDDERQRLWPLILASIGTGRPRHLMVSLRLWRTAQRAVAADGDRLRVLWGELLGEYDRNVPRHERPPNLRRLEEAALEHHPGS
ncbi:MAG TPA: hypothetical protein VNF07_12795 [Acidimicrobiales bacterium]|nr:hypothetical protein [Acidimicrobiales bacterium]